MTQPSLGSIVFVVRLRTRDEMGTGPIFARHRRVAFLAAVAALATLATVVDAATPDELREQRRDVQAQAAELASQVDAATADVADLEVALAAAQANVDAQQAAVEAANRASSTPTRPRPPRLRRSSISRLKRNRLASTCRTP